MGSLRAGLLASLRPWPGSALEAAMGLAQEGCAAGGAAGPADRFGGRGAAGSAGGPALPAEVSRRAFVLCAGNPLLLEQLAVAIGRGEDVPGAGSRGGLFGQGVLLARFAGLPPAGMRCAQAASVLGTRFLPEVAAQVAGLEGARSMRLSRRWAGPG